MSFPPSWRRFVLLVHVVTSVGLVGAVMAFLALAGAGLAGGEGHIARGAYLGMAVITWWVVVPLAAASLVGGVVQSLGTPWGLFRHYWVIVKLVLTIVAVMVLLLQTGSIDRLAEAAADGSLAAMSGARLSMVLHAGGGLAVLVAATVLSVYKPRGLTACGASRLG